MRDSNPANGGVTPSPPAKGDAAAARPSRTPSGPPPFAGIDRQPDTFGECVRAIERGLADPADRRRVAAWLVCWAAMQDP